MLDMKSKSLDVAVICGPVLAGLQMLLLTNFVASCNNTRYSKSCPLCSCYNIYCIEVSVIFTLLHERRHHQIEVGLLGKAVLDNNMHLMSRCMKNGDCVNGMQCCVGLHLTCYRHQLK